VYQARGLLLTFSSSRSRAVDLEFVSIRVVAVVNGSAFISARTNGFQLVTSDRLRGIRTFTLETDSSGRRSSACRGTPCDRRLKGQKDERDNCSNGGGRLPNQLNVDKRLREPRPWRVGGSSPFQTKVASRPVLPLKAY
jgi:hypothetical protein